MTDEVAIEKNKWWRSVGRHYVQLLLDLRKAFPSAECDREKLAAWMIDNQFAAGHGDTFDDLLSELEWQIAEIRARGANMENSELPYSERELIQRAIRSLDHKDSRGLRWVLVKKLFGTSSEHARSICYRYGFDPDKKYF